MTEYVLLKYGKLWGYSGLSESSQKIVDEGGSVEELIKNLRRPHKIQSDFSGEVFRTKRSAYEYLEREKR